MNPKGLCLGIDFGTSTIYVTKWNFQKKCAEAVKNITNDSEPIFDNSIFYDSKTQITLGAEAYEKGISDPLNYVESIKRHIGEDNWTQRIKVFGRELNSVEVATDIFREIKNRIESKYKETIEKTVISVPFAFLHKERQRIKNAANAAGLNVIGLIEEPVAAAISYGLFNETTVKNKKEKILIFDFGGGTLDITIFEIEKVNDNEIRIEVLCTDGLKNLGGKDIDNILFDKMVEIEKCDISEMSNKDIIKLKHNAIKVKEALSEENINQETFMVTDLDCKKKISQVITRDKFDDYLTANSIKSKIKNLLDDLFNEIKIETKQIDRIILVGGSSKIPLIFEKIQKFFKKDPEKIKKPLKLVGEGAGIYCGSLIDKDLKYTIVRKISHSIGVKVGQEFEPFIERNSKYEVFSAVKKLKIDHIVSDKEFSKISIYQGNSRDIKNCSKVGDIVYNRKDIVNNEISIQLGTDANGMVRYKLFRTDEIEPFKEGEINEDKEERSNIMSEPKKNNKIEQENNNSQENQGLKIIAETPDKSNLPAFKNDNSDNNVKKSTPQKEENIEETITESGEKLKKQLEKIQNIVLEKLDDLSKSNENSHDFQKNNLKSISQLIDQIITSIKELATNKNVNDRLTTLYVSLEKNINNIIKEIKSEFSNNGLKIKEVEKTISNINSSIIQVINTNTTNSDKQIEKLKSSVQNSQIAAEKVLNKISKDIEGNHEELNHKIDSPAFKKDIELLQGKTANIEKITNELKEKLSQKGLKISTELPPSEMEDTEIVELTKYVQEAIEQLSTAARHYARNKKQIEEIRETQIKHTHEIQKTKVDYRKKGEDDARIKFVIELAGKFEDLDRLFSSNEPTDAIVSAFLKNNGFEKDDELSSGNEITINDSNIQAIESKAIFTQGSEKYKVLRSCYFIGNNIIKKAELEKIEVKNNDVKDQTTNDSKEYANADKKEGGQK